MSDAKILVVEDEGITALDIQNRLTSLGYTVPDIASAGAEAVEKAGVLSPDLVLMDIMLPGEIDGVTAAEQIQSRFDIPIIYLTAYADEATLQRAKLTEPYGYIVKPFKERELHIAIDMALYKHKMERKLKESEKWFATTLWSIGDAVIATDKNGLITFMNPVAESLMGWKLKEVANKNLKEIFNIINRDTRLPVENPVTKVLLEGLVVGLANHTILIARDGTEIPIDDSAAPIIDDKDNIIGVILVFRDITERERGEEELRRARDELEQRVQERTAELESAKEELEVINEELSVEIDEHKKIEKELLVAKESAEEAAKVKAAFMANMSHELRTPMNAVIGMTSLLLDTRLDAEQKDFVETIRTGGEALMTLISDILDFSRVEKEKVELEHQPLSLRTLVEESLDLVAASANEKGLSLSHTIKYGTPDMIIGDPGRLRQILVNLLSNAVKFTDSGDVSVSVSSKAIESSKHQIHFKVMDTGIGIPADKMDRLFQPFGQLEMTISRKRDGAGLGLAISKGLVDLMGGEIWVESKSGVGSTFHFTIPAEVASSKYIMPDRTTGAVSKDIAKQHPLRILVAEDNHLNQKMLLEMLRRMGYIADAVADGREVLQALERQPYDLIFMDISAGPLPARRS